MAGLPVIFVGILALAVSMGGENLLQFVRFTCLLKE
jgi:hypothetical protein